MLEMIVIGIVVVLAALYVLWTLVRSNEPGDCRCGRDRCPLKSDPFSRPNADVDKKNSSH